MQKFTRYYEAISFLECLTNLPSKGNYLIDRTNLDVYLKRMRYFLNLLDNPDKNLKFIHITGTAGKGSVTNMLHEILHAAGNNVGSFTSPFVTTSIEKIKVGELYISTDEFSDIVERIKPAIDKAYTQGPYGMPSYFEIFFAIALIYFKKKKCEWVVLEAGCGGRYDATNVIKNPVVTAITNIDYDHVEIFGPTLDDIAYEKSGIIKKGSLFFTSEQRPKLQTFLNTVCKKEGASFHQIPYKDNYEKYNKSLVTEISNALKVETRYITKGIKRSHLQCRFETMQKNPLVVIDGAHNKIKVESTLTNLKKLSYKRLFLIVGISDSKEHLSMLEQVVPISDYIYFTRFRLKDRTCAHPKDLFIKSKRYLKKGVKTDVLLDCNMALEKALAKARKDDLVLVVGSFFLAGELRKKWYPEEYLLQKRRCK